MMGKSVKQYNTVIKEINLKVGNFVGFLQPEENLSIQESYTNE